MQTLDSPAALEALAKVTHIYTDLDGTLLAPGGRLLTTHHGKPSVELATCLVRLKKMGVEVVITTGRDAGSATEIMRLLNLEQFIGEMGCVVQFGYGVTASKHYNLGDWTTEHFDQDYNLPASITPFEMIARSGAVANLLHAFPGRLEEQTLKTAQREVTHALRGDVDTSPGGEVDLLLAEQELPLQLLDNGIIHPRNHGLLHVDEIHIYHLMPRGTGKGEAIALDMATKGITAEQVVAIGDAEGDVYMGKYSGSFVLVDDHKKNSPAAFAEATVANPAALFTTTHPSADGWVEFAHALLKAKQES